VQWNSGDRYIRVFEEVCRPVGSAKERQNRIKNETQNFKPSDAWVKKYKK